MTNLHANPKTPLTGNQALFDQRSTTSAQGRPCQKNQLLSGVNEDQFLAIWKDSVYIRKFALNAETVMSMFVPNTLWVWWNTSPEDFCSNGIKSIILFDGCKKQKVQALGLTQKKSAPLPSIVQAWKPKADGDLLSLECNLNANANAACHFKQVIANFGPSQRVILPWKKFWIFITISTVPTYL